MASQVLCPLPTCRIVNGKGARFGEMAALGGQIHTGLDLVAPIGTPVHSPLPGVVSNVKQSVDGGLGLRIAHTDRLTTIYAHLSRILVREGDMLTAGRIVAYTGASGMVTGPHLHFGVMVDGQLVDPAKPVDTGGAAGGRSPGADDIIGYPQQGCPAGMVPAKIDSATGAVPIPFVRWIGGGLIAAIGTPGEPPGPAPRDWNACLREGQYQVGQDPFGLGTVPGQVAEAAGSLFQLALPALLEPALNIGVVAGSVVLVYNGLKRILDAP